MSILKTNGNVELYRKHHKNVVDAEGRIISILDKPYSILDAAKMYGIDNSGHIRAEEHVELYSIFDYDTLAIDYYPDYALIFDSNDVEFDNFVNFSDFRTFVEPYALLDDKESGLRHLVVSIRYDMELDANQFWETASVELSKEAEENGWICTDTDCCQWYTRNQNGTFHFVQLVELDTVTPEEAKEKYVVVAIDDIDVKAMPETEKQTVLAPYYPDLRTEDADEETMAECYFEEESLSDTYVVRAFSEEWLAAWFILNDYIPAYPGYKEDKV